LRLAIVLTFFSVQCQSFLLLVQLVSNVCNSFSTVYNVSSARVRRSTLTSNCTCKRSICESSDVAVAVRHVAILDAIAMIAVARWKFLPAPLVIDLASLSILAVVVRHWWGRVFGIVIDYDALAVGAGV
jgi:hypothetical protein